MNSTDSDDDFAWISNETRLLSSSTIYSREPVNRISIWYIYVSREQTVDKISRQWFSFQKSNSDSDNASISLLQIESLLPATDYQITEIMLYHIPIDSDELPSYSQSNIQRSIPFLNRVWSRENGKESVCNIPIPPSISIFHDVNTLYCILEEPATPPIEDPVADPNEQNAYEDEVSDFSSEEDEPSLENVHTSHSIHPILKNTMKQKPTILHGITKKVRINLTPQIMAPKKISIKKGKKTRKYFSSKNINTTIV